MAHLAVIWELGAGLGHIMQDMMVVKGLAARGHRVSVVVRDLSQVHRFYWGRNVSFHQAPIRLGPSVEPVYNFASILMNCGFADPGDLATRAQSWRDLFGWLRPNAVLFDHSPTALLAASSFRFRKILLGVGFSHPPDENPMMWLRHWEPLVNEAAVADCERRCLANINLVRDQAGLGPLQQVSHLYTQADLSILATIKEVEHYPHRLDGRYYGFWPWATGRVPSWPEVPGLRVFAYLKPFAALPDLLRTLAAGPYSVLLYSSEIADDVLRSHAAPNIRCERQPVDIRAAAAQCDLAILNGTAATTGALLMAGKPILQLPLYIEQNLVGLATVRSGAGLMLPSDDTAGIPTALRKLSGGNFADAGRKIAQRYADYDPYGQLQKALDDIEAVS